MTLKKTNNNHTRQTFIFINKIIDLRVCSAAMGVCMLTCSGMHCPRNCKCVQTGSLIGHRRHHLHTMCAHVFRLISIFVFIYLFIFYSRWWQAAAGIHASHRKIATVNIHLRRRTRRRDSNPYCVVWLLLLLLLLVTFFVVWFLFSRERLSKFVSNKIINSYFGADWNRADIWHRSSIVFS